MDEFFRDHSDEYGYECDDLCTFNLLLDYDPNKYPNVHLIECASTHHMNMIENF